MWVSPKQLKWRSSTEETFHVAHRKASWQNCWTGNGEVENNSSLWKKKKKLMSYTCSKMELWDYVFIWEMVKACMCLGTYIWVCYICVCVHLWLPDRFRAIQKMIYRDNLSLLSTHLIQPNMMMCVWWKLESAEVETHLPNWSLLSLIDISVVSSWGIDHTQISV